MVRRDGAEGETTKAGPVAGFPHFVLGANSTGRDLRVLGFVMGLLVFAAALAAAGKSDVADAAQRGDAAAVQALIAKKADVNAAQNDGSTALHWAVFRGDAAMANLLIRAGANVKAATREGSTPLWLASINGDAKTIGLLLEAGADANEKLPLGRSPLMIAARTGNVDAMKVLIDHGPTSTPRKRSAARRR